MKKILILGGTGFVGRHLCEKLAEGDYRTTVLTRRRANANHLQMLPMVDVIEGSASDAATLIPMIAGHDVAYHDFEGIATELEERERLVEDLGTKHSMILRNHGTLTVGESIPQAFLRMYFLERACEAQVLMLSAGRENLNTPNQGVAEKVEGQSSGPGMRMLADGLAWPALLRKLDRIDPSYRD